MLGPSEGLEVIVRSDGVNMGRKTTPLPSRTRERKTGDPFLGREVSFILSPFDSVSLVKVANEIFLRRSIKLIRTCTVAATGAGFSSGSYLGASLRWMRVYRASPSRKTLRFDAPLRS
jgi:hypothetical protein